MIFFTGMSSQSNYTSITDVIQQSIVKNSNKKQYLIIFPFFKSPPKSGCDKLCMQVLKTQSYIVGIKDKAQLSTTDNIIYMDIS